MISLELLLENVEDLPIHSFPSILVSNTSSKDFNLFIQANIREVAFLNSFEDQTLLQSGFFLPKVFKNKREHFKVGFYAHFGTLQEYFGIVDLELTILKDLKSYKDPNW